MRHTFNRNYLWPVLILLGVFAFSVHVFWANFSRSEPIDQLGTDDDSPKDKFDSIPPGSPQSLDDEVGNKSRTLVIASLQEEDTSWVERELANEPDLKRAIYIVDNSSAAFHVPVNKGHEVMAYLTYIIDHYDQLSHITMFMHSHQKTWHNEDLLERDAANVVRRLSTDRVDRLGYMNLRCELRPGCPSHLHPGHPVQSQDHPEEVFWPKAWQELFPDSDIPDTVSQSCCGQFAVSKSRIRHHPLTTYQRLREWLINTELEDRISGRVWEYLWQILFWGEREYCPPQYLCLCDGYGICFGSESAYDAWRNKTEQLNQLSKSNSRKVEDEETLKDEIEAETRAAFVRGISLSHRAMEVSKQCNPAGSQTEWNTAHVSWRQSRVCLEGGG